MMMALMAVMMSPYEPIGMLPLSRAVKGERCRLLPEVRLEDIPTKRKRPAVYVSYNHVTTVLFTKKNN